MKILIDNKGQTCNKFWTYLAPIELALSKKESIFIIFPDSKLSDYPNIVNNSYIKLPFLYKVASKLFGFNNLEKVTRKVFTNRFYDIIPILCKTFPHIFWKVWDNRDIEIKKDTYDLIQYIFSPKKSIKDLVEKKFALERKEADIIIGVHIRRGDYEKWLNGKYFFSFNEYLRICLSLKTEFAHKKCKFFLASNEGLPSYLYNELNSFTIGQNAASDLYALSCCDYIVGPPSSFSRWASFFGKIPIRFILSPTQLTKSFRTISSYSKYSNGESIEFDN